MIQRRLWKEKNSSDPGYFQKAQCSLVPCQLPARKPLMVNDDWRRALDDAEDALFRCVVQVIGCIHQEDFHP